MNTQTFYPNTKGCSEKRQLFKSKADKLSMIFASLSALMFFGAIASAILLPVYGLYLALTLVFFCGFSMLMSAMITEKSKSNMAAKFGSQKKGEDEEEALI